MPPNFERQPTLGGFSRAAYHLNIVTVESKSILSPPFRQENRKLENKSQEVLHGIIRAPVQNNLEQNNRDLIESTIAVGTFAES